MSVVLITGAYGFVGTNLSAYLSGRGFEPWALDVCVGSSKVLKCVSSKVEGRASSPNARIQVGAYARSFDWGQLEDIPWCEVDAVVHLAGKAHDTRNASDPQSYFDVNVGLTKKVVEALREGERSKPLAFILFSSVKAVADRVEGVLTEDVVPDPKTPYGKSKLEAEREVLKFGSSKVREFETAEEGNFRTLELSNFRTYILRPCMIHGPGNKGNLNLLYGIVKRGIPWPLGAFENRRSFASIGNVCAAVEGLLKGAACPGVYQVADDDALSTNELIGVMAEALGRRVRIWRLPAGLVRAVAKAGDVLRLPLNSERLKKLTESYEVSNAKLKRALGWAKMPVSAREGLKRTLESFKKEA